MNKKKKNQDNDGFYIQRKCLYMNCHHTQELHMYQRMLIQLNGTHSCHCVKNR